MSASRRHINDQCRRDADTYDQLIKYRLPSCEPTKTPEDEIDGELTIGLCVLYFHLIPPLRQSIA
jgi:hypothetical protein